MHNDDFRIDVHLHVANEPSLQRSTEGKTNKYSITNIVPVCSSCAFKATIHVYFRTLPVTYATHVYSLFK